MLKSEIKEGDRLLWKPGTQDFRRCTVLKVGDIVELMGSDGLEFGRKLEDVMANCDRADLDTGIK